MVLGLQACVITPDGYQIQGFLHARRAFYHLSWTPKPISLPFIYFLSYFSFYHAPTKSQGGASQSHALEDDKKMRAKGNEVGETQNLGVCHESHRAEGALWDGVGHRFDPIFLAVHGGKLWVPWQARCSEPEREKLPPVVIQRTLVNSVGCALSHTLPEDDKLLSYILSHF